MHTPILASSTHRSFLAAVALALTSQLTFASTWVVDDDPGVGVDFATIAEAMTVAAPGDVVLVRAGTYGGFTINTPITVLGEGRTAVTVTGLIQIQNLPIDSRTVISGMTNISSFVLRAQSCAGRLVVENVNGPSGQVLIQNCADVRLSKCDIHGRNGSNSSNPSSPFIDGTSAIVVEQSFAEIVDSNLVGGDGGDCVFCQEDGGSGGHGVVVTSGEAHVSRTSMRGGNGGDANVGFLVVGAYGGSGGNGIRVGISTQPSKALVTGDSTHVLANSVGGSGSDGSGSIGSGLFVYSVSAARVSGVHVSGQSISGTLESPVDADPHMTQLNTATPGGLLPFRITAPPGSMVDIVFGRGLDFIATPGLEEDVLVQRLRVFNLGVVDGTGVKDFTLIAPAYLPTGFAFHAQAEIVYPDATLRRTNSVALILR